MINIRSNKQKFIIITGTVVVLIWFSYRFSFSKTIDLWKECKRLEQQKTFIRAIPEKLPLVSKKVEQLEKVLGYSGEEDFSTLILEQVNDLCQQNNVRLKEIPEKHVFNGENLIVETLDINLQGSFNDQIKIISELEKREAKTRLRSLRLQIIEDQSKDERRLQGTLFLQSIKLISNDTNKSGYAKIDN